MQKSRKGKLAALSVEKFVVPLRSIHNLKTKYDMKRLAFLLPLVLLACSEVELPDEHPNVSPNVEEYTKKFTFTVKGDFTNSEFRDTRAYMTADGAEMTDLWVVDVKNGSIYQTLHLTPSDADWGTPQMSLTLGTHHVKFLASRGADPRYSDGAVAWSKPLDTFFTDYEVTVVKTSNGNRAVTLDRVSSKLQITIDDAIPTGTTTFTTESSKWFCGWDMVKGEPIASSYSREFSVPESWIGQTGASLTLWSLSGADEWTTDVQLTSFAGSVQNAAATITAPMKANRTTVMHGNLYTSNSSTSISLNTNWLPQYEGVY